MSDVESRRGPVEVADVWKLYEATAADFVRDRRLFGGEQKYLAGIASRLPKGASVLDLGCGSGVPIAQFFIDWRFDLTGVDAAPAMVAACRERFPEATWFVEDMRRLALGRRFDAIVAWDSFFHLPPDDQRAMFAIFRAHSAPGGFLLFTAGPEAGERIGNLYGHRLYHASLAEEEYGKLLADNGFDVLSYRPDDRDCGGHTVWLARRSGGGGR